MKKYRIIQFENESYGIQCKSWFFGFWITLPVTTEILSGAESYIVQMREKDAEEIARRKGLKIAKVVK